jgi:hypothetical protein
MVAAPKAEPARRDRSPLHALLLADDVEGAAGRNQAMCSAFIVCEQVKGTTVPSALWIALDRLVGGQVGQAHDGDAIVDGDLVVVGGIGEPQGSTPCFLRLVSAMRAKLRQMEALALRNRGSMAACSRDEPSP